MKLTEKIEILNQIPLLKNCSKETVKMIAEDTYLKKYRRNDLVMSANTAIHRIAIIANDGRMKIMIHNNDADEYIVYLLSLGDLFNVISLLDDKKDFLSASAMDDLDILHCNVDIARNWITQCSDFNKNLLKYLSNRLRMAQKFNMERTFYKIEIRLARLIFHNIVSDDNQLNLINNLSHEEIAKLLGTSRAVVNRNLQKLRKDQLIDIQRKKILIHDYERLKEYIEQYDMLL